MEPSNAILNALKVDIPLKISYNNGILNRR